MSASLHPLSSEEGDASETLSLSLLRSILHAWYPVPPHLNGTMLLAHLSQDHPDQVGCYLDQMRGSEDIGEVAAQAYEIVEEHEMQ
jgi:hypothetical protein